MQTIAMGGVRTMTKPTVFSYKDYTDLKAKYEELVMDYTKLKAENTNLRIKCRILETDLEEMRNGKST